VLWAECTNEHREVLVAIASAELAGPGDTPAPDAQATKKK
jgi:hypothetical protein